jgi:hypothetical protein
MLAGKRVDGGGAIHFKYRHCVDSDLQLSIPSINDYLNYLARGNILLRHNDDPGVARVRLPGQLG